jgi:4-hydroxy-2-oxoheptanedioate aldolase
MVQAAGISAPDYLKQANQLTLAFAMIETRAALDAVEEIAAVPGLDGLFVGPSDLSIALSNGAELNRTSPATLAAMKHVAAACEKKGLVPGAFAGTADGIKTYAALGYRFLAAAVDVDLMRSGAMALEAELKSG